MPPVPGRAGRCYELVGQFAVGLSHLIGDDAFEIDLYTRMDGCHVEACHGFPRVGPGHPLAARGFRLGHAWIEITPPGAPTLVYCVVYGSMFPASAYYEAGEIDPATVYRFTRGELTRRVVVEQHYGPFNEYHPELTVPVVYRNDPTTVMLLHPDGRREIEPLDPVSELRAD